MVKAKAADVRANLNRLGADFRAVLVFGPDDGVVRERLDIFSKQVVEDISDPFNVASPTPAQIKDDPALLLDEVSAISMMGGRRLVRVDGASDVITGSVENVLESQVGEGLLLIGAGDLNPRSKLRKLFEAAGNAIAIPCYADSAAELEQMIRDMLRKAGYSADGDAMAYLLANLGSDRMISRSEISKLLLYLEGGDEKTVSLADVRAIIGDSGAWMLEDIASVAADGDIPGLDRLLERAEAGAENAVTILRVLVRRLQRLYFVSGLMAEGASFDSAAGKLRPPLFFKDKPAFRNQAGKWSPGSLTRALQLVSEAEIQCKSTGLPAFAIAARVCLQIATAARRPR
ncbi:MAG: DNA polymerase III subunit delta [Sphingomonadales bacterium]